MDITTFIAFNATLVVAIASPGPALLYMLRTTLSAGRQTGIRAGMGLSLMAALWTLAALLGLETLFTLFPWAYAGLKTLGALYLIYLAWGMWRGAKNEISAATKPGHSQAFLSGLLINLANPKSIFFAAAVLVVIFPPALSTLDKALIFGNHLAVEIIAQTSFAFLLSTPAIRRGYLNAKPIFDRLAATVLGLLGLNLLLNR